MALFSINKWPYFRLSKFMQEAQSGLVFGQQMALFSIDKNMGDRASESTLLSYFKERTAPFWELGEIIEVSPAEAREFVEFVRRSISYTFTDLELLEAARDTVSLPRTVEKIIVQLGVNKLASVFGIKKEYARTLLNTIEREAGYPITVNDILNEHTLCVSMGRQLAVEELSLAWRIAKDRYMSFHNAIILAEPIKLLGGGHASYSETLAAYKALVDKRPMAIAACFREILLARKLNVSVDKLRDVREQITKDIGRGVTLEEIVDVVTKTEDLTTMDQLEAWYHAQARPVLKVAEALQMSPQQAREVIAEIQKKAPPAYSEDDIVRIVQSLPPQVRTVKEIIDEFSIHQLAEQLGYETRTLKALADTIVDEIGRVSDYKRIAEAVVVCRNHGLLPRFEERSIPMDVFEQHPTHDLLLKLGKMSATLFVDSHAGEDRDDIQLDTVMELPGMTMIIWESESLAGVIAVLQLSKALGKKPSQLDDLWRDAERRSGKLLDLQTFIALARSLPSSAYSDAEIARWLSLFDLFHVNSSDSSIIRDVYASYPNRKPPNRFWALCKLYEGSEETTVRDLQYIRELSLWPQSSIDIILPDIDLGERLVSSRILIDLRHRRSGQMERTEDLTKLARHSWEQINSDRRAYAIPSLGRAEILTSKRIRDIWGLNALRFVQEGINAPKVFVQFKFGDPARIGIMRIEDGETDLGFLMMSDDLWLRAFFRAIALTYYRDLVLPGPIYVPTVTRLSHPRRKTVGAKLPHEQSNVLPRPRTISQEKVYQFYDWHMAQERARHSVTGHVRWVHKGFVADDSKHQQAQQAGVQLSSGYTWVVEHERGNPQQREGVKLTEDFDLVQHTFFAAPTKATAELEALF